MVAELGEVKRPLTRVPAVSLRCTSRPLLHIGETAVPHHKPARRLARDDSGTVLTQHSDYFNELDTNPLRDVGNPV